MSDSGSQHSFPNSPTTADGSNPYVNGNIINKDQERKSSAVSNSASNSNQLVLTQKQQNTNSILKENFSKRGIKETPCLNEILSKSATYSCLSTAQLVKAVAGQNAAETSEAIQQAATLLQHQQPVMAKKTNAFSHLNKDIATSASGMVQLNLVNENGTVTPIEINASVAAAALVAAQKHQNYKFEAAVHSTHDSTPIRNTVVTSNLGNDMKNIEGEPKSLKTSNYSNNGNTFNVSYLYFSFFHSAC